jgi:hypothetical protein
MLWLGAMWVACTALLLAFRPGYGFPTAHLVDSWIYTSYQWDFHRQIAEFGPTYYASRLSWILPGVLLHHLFDPVTANICYKLLASAVTALACGILVQRVKGLTAGLLAVGIAVVAPPMIKALQADYVDIAVLMYAILALACIARAAHSGRWALWIFLAGVAFSGMTVANLSALAVPGLGIAAFHLLWLRWGFKRNALCLGLYLAAALLVISGIDFIWRRAGATTHFLRPQIDMIFYFGEMKGENPWAPKNWHWVIGATWLVLPVAALVLGLMRSAFAPHADATVQRFTLALTAGLAVSLGTGLILEWRNIAVLAQPYYAHAHLCLALPLLALVGSPEIPTRRPWRLAAVIAGLLLVVLAGNALGFNALLRGLEGVIGVAECAPLLLAGVLLAGATLCFFRSRPRSISGAELLLVGLGACSAPIDFDHPRVSDHLRERYAAIHSAYQVIAREFAPDSYRFWVDARQQDGRALASSKLWLYRLFTEKMFPGFETPDLSGRTLIVPGAPGAGPLILTRAKERLRARGLELASPRILQVPGAAGMGFDLVCFKMQTPTLDPDDPALATTITSLLVDLRADASPPYTAALEQNLYGPRSSPPIGLASGQPTFTRTDARDHLATPFISFTRPKPGAPRKLSLVIVMPAAGSNASCIVQSDSFAELGRFPLDQAGRTVRSLLTPAGCQRVRLYFQSGTDLAVPLPLRVSLYEINP